MLYSPLSLYNFISLLKFFVFPSQQFYYFPSSMFFIPLLHLHLLIYSIYFSIHKYIDLLATLHHPTSTPHRPCIYPSSTPHRPYIDPIHRPHIDPTLNFFNTASWIVKLYTTTTTTTTTFLLFFLHHHHHRHNIAFRDFKMQRRGRQRERQKNNRFN